jgi:hypothetical protein
MQTFGLSAIMWMSPKKSIDEERFSLREAGG